MATQGKAITGQDIIIGCATVGNGTKTPVIHDDRSRTIHYASGDDLSYYQMLDGRFKTPPSGWNE